MATQKPAVEKTAEPKPEEKKPRFISEGVRQDLLLNGETTDPVTGERLTREDLP